MPANKKPRHRRLAGEEAEDRRRRRELAERRHIERKAAPILAIGWLSIIVAATALPIASHRKVHICFSPMVANALGCGLIILSIYLVLFTWRIRLAVIRRSTIALRQEFFSIGMLSAAGLLINLWMAANVLRTACFI